MTQRNRETGRFQATVVTGPTWSELLAGHTVTSFTQLTGVPRESLSRWAKGTRPRAGSVAQLALALERPASEVQRLLDQIHAEAITSREETLSSRAIPASVPESEANTPESGKNHG